MTAKKSRTKKSAARPRTFEEVKAANLADPFHAARIARVWMMGERFDDPNGPSDDPWAREVFVHPDCEGVIKFEGQPPFLLPEAKSAQADVFEKSVVVTLYSQVGATAQG